MNIWRIWPFRLSCWMMTTVLLWVKLRTCLSDQDHRGLWSRGENAGLCWYSSFKSKSQLNRFRRCAPGYLHPSPLEAHLESFGLRNEEVARPYQTALKVILHLWLLFSFHFASLQNSWQFVVECYSQSLFPVLWIEAIDHRVTGVFLN